MRAGARVTPRRRLHAVAEAKLEQRVPRRMELDPVGAVENRRMLVRQAPPLERLAPELGPEGKQVVLGPRPTLATKRLEQRRVRRDEVVVAERRRLVGGADSDGSSLRRDRGRA
jgi:hypothetical protein